MKSRIKHLLAACFFVGGATSLILEVAWAKELSYSLGNTLYAVSTSIAAFMAGLAFGSHLASRYLGAVRHPVLVYAGLQLVIGLCGAISIPVFWASPPLLVSLHDALRDFPTVFLASRFALVFLLMVLPVTLMGMTLPLMAGIYGRAKERYDFETGILYGVNTLGAVTGCMLAGFAMIPHLGLFRTCVTVGAVDAFVGLVALALHPALRHTVPAPGCVPAPPADAVPDESRVQVERSTRDLIGALYFLSGLVAIVLEVSWFRFLSYVFGPTANAFSVMLAAFLVGIGLGSVLGARITRDARHPLFRVAQLELLIALVVILTVAFYNQLPGWYGTLFFGLPENSVGAALVAQSAIAALVVLPATLLMGILFPVVVRCYSEVDPDRREAEHTVGRLYALNTIGGIAGSFLAGFWLLPRIGIWNTQLAASCITVLIGMGFLMLEVRRPLRSRLQLAAAAVGVFALLAISAPRLDFLALNKGSYLALANKPGFKSMMGNNYDAGRRLLFYREGINNSVAVTANDGNSGNLFLRVSGKPVADTRMTGRAHLALLGQLPFLFAKETKRVAVIGFGTGVTTGSSLTHSAVESLELAELEGAVFEASNFFRYRNRDPFSDPRFHPTVEDGRTFLFYADDSFDVITTDPISPIVAGAANLYTTDFYKLAASRLDEGGIFCQWLETWIPSEYTIKGILASALDAFPHTALFLIGSDFAILGSNDPIQVPWEVFVSRFKEEKVREDLAQIGIRSPEQLMGFYLGGNESLRAYVGSASPNTDDWNWLERRMPYELNLRRRENALGHALVALASLRVAELRQLSPGMPMEDIVRATAELPPPTFPNGARKVMLKAFVVAFQRERNPGLADLTRSLLARWDEEEIQPISKQNYGRLVRAARRASQAGRNDEAEPLLRELLQHPTGRFFYGAGIALGEVLNETGRHEEALSYARLMQEEFAAHQQAYSLEAHILQAMGRPEEARRAAERGLIYNPDDPTLLSLLEGSQAAQDGS